MNLALSKRTGFIQQRLFRCARAIIPNRSFSENIMTEPRRASEMIRRVIAGNHEFIHDDSFEGHISDWVQKGQSPHSTILTCCDSRIPANAIGMFDANEVFSVRNIGNQIGNSEGSFRFGLEVLRTPNAVIVGHTNCGAVNASLSDYRHLHTHIQQEVVTLLRVVRFADSLKEGKALEKMDQSKRQAVYSELNVDYQIHKLIRDWRIGNYLTDGSLTVLGLMIDLDNSYGHGHGKVHIVNINGVNKRELLLQSPVLDDVDPLVRDVTVSRLFEYNLE